VDLIALQKGRFPGTSIPTFVLFVSFVVAFFICPRASEAEDELRGCLSLRGALLGRPTETRRLAAFEFSGKAC